MINFPLPCVKDCHYQQRKNEVDYGGQQHQVKTTLDVLIEGDTAPCRLFDLLSLVEEVVDFGEPRPGQSRTEANYPDPADDFLCLSVRRRRKRGKGMTDGNVPMT